VTRLAILTIFLTLALAAQSFAAEHVGHDGGEGTYGLTNDKVVTNAGFLIIGGLPLLIFILSLIQWRLDKRKEDRKKAAKARAGAPVWRGGW
jgi:TRAP-type mannitol/chloroaromatic compound transport system permease small subunit